MAEPQPGSAPPPELSAEEERRQRLKAAGEAYFAKVLHQSKGKDLLAAAKLAAPTLSGGGGSGMAVGAQRLPLTTFDEDFLQAGMVIEGARTYVLGATFVAAQAVQLVFLKASLTALQTPALLACIHFLPVVLLLWLLAAQGLLELRPLSLRTLQGSVVATVLGGLQTLTLFWAVLHSSVFLVLCWTTATPHLLRAAIDMLLNERRLPRGRIIALGMGLGCTVSTLLVQFPGVLGLLGLLAWTVAEVVGASWAQLRQRPDLAARVVAAQGSMGGLLSQLLDAEAALDSASVALMQHLLPMLPLLLLGLLMREGRELVDHELSVPAVMMILLSCLALAVTVSTNLLISGGLTRQAHAALAAAGPLGTVVTEAVVHGLSSPVAFVAAIMCSIAGMLLRFTAVSPAGS